MKPKKIPNLDLIRKRMGHHVSITPIQKWLDMGQEKLHRVLGSERRGVPYGKMIEVSGNESQGKTALAMEIAAYGQVDGALIIWVGLEELMDKRWARLRGMNYDQIMRISPFLKETKSEPELSSVEDLCAEVTASIKAGRKIGFQKFIVVIDSIAAMVTAKEAEVGELVTKTKKGKVTTDIAEFNMNVNTELSRFLSRTLKKWAGYGMAYNVMFILINQIRTKPGVNFGNPEYTTGGRAPGYYSSIRVKLYRTKGGRITNSGKIIGIKGIISNFKNKVGGGSIEGDKIGFKLFFDRPAKFFEANEIK